jgi:hypothetical protein
MRSATSSGCSIALVAAAFDAVEPVADVLAPHGFAELAVVDDVESGLGLASYDVGDRGGEPGEGRGVLFASFREGPGQLGGPLQGADVRGEDPVGASLHSFPL